jgi:VWFA-related protein
VGRTAPSRWLFVVFLGMAVEASAGSSLEISVSRVEVDVVVLDGNGQFVPGLKREDFEVFEDGKPVEIADFELRSQVSASPAPAATQGPVPTQLPAEPRKFILFADLMNSSVRGVKSVQRDLLRFVNEAMLPADEMMIGLLAPDTRTLVLQLFTSSRPVLIQKIQSLQGNPKIDFYFRSQEDSLLNALEAPEGENSALGIARAAASEQYERASLSLNALASFVELVDKRGWQTGPKTVLFLSDGEGLVAGQMWFDIYNRVTRTRDEQKSYYDLQPLLRKTVSRLNLMRATVYSFSTRGIFQSSTNDATRFGPSPLSAGEQLLSFLSSQDSLSSVAADTGGISYINRSSFDTALHEVEKDTRTSYLLTYSPPPHKGGKPEFHKIEVRCRRPGTKVRARRGYLD